MNFDMTRSGPGKLLLRFALPLILPCLSAMAASFAKGRLFSLATAYK